MQLEGKIVEFDPTEYFLNIVIFDRAHLSWLL